MSGWTFYLRRCEEGENFLTAMFVRILDCSAQFAFDSDYFYGLGMFWFVILMSSTDVGNQSLDSSDHGWLELFF